MTTSTRISREATHETVISLVRIDNASRNGRSYLEAAEIADRGKGHVTVLKTWNVDQEQEAKDWCSHKAFCDRISQTEDAISRMPRPAWMAR